MLYNLTVRRTLSVYTSYFCPYSTLQSRIARKNQRTVHFSLKRESGAHYIYMGWKNTLLDNGVSGVRLAAPVD